MFHTHQSDVFEAKYAPLFLRADFPHYEQFWSRFVVPLTQRPVNINAKNDIELKRMGKGPKDICLTQLSYTVFRHVARAYDLKMLPDLDFDAFVEGLARLSTALDVAFELFERATNPEPYEEWNEKHGKRARERWRDSHKQPLQNVKSYRNRLSHGHIVPSYSFDAKKYSVPRIGKETEYLDWRKVTNATVPPSDFDTAHNVLTAAWKEVVTYLDDQWETVLLKIAPPAALPVFVFVPGGSPISHSAGVVVSSPSASGTSIIPGMMISGDGNGLGPSLPLFIKCKNPACGNIMQMPLTARTNQKIPWENASAMCSRCGTDFSLDEKDFFFMGGDIGPEK